MENKITNLTANETPKLKWSYYILGLVIVVLAIAVWLLIGRSDRKDVGTGVSAGSISQKTLDNKFGFLGGGSKDDGKIIIDYGAAWVRPHPGPFLWDAMQANAGAKIDFSQTDAVVLANQALEIGTLATLWPFADWDQVNLPNAAGCKVSPNDEFLPKNDKKGRGSYLPQYRCQPKDWLAYQSWVVKIIERYDGDGKDDMPGLKMPVKYWEVMNEPDLTLPPDDNGRLDFWKGDAADYAELLIKTSAAIRSADSSAKILIAGAAGGDKQFLDFYREVLKNRETLDAFDIANVHCISNDEKTHDFNVGVYKTMLLSEFNIQKPIWVTEAEAFYRGNKTAEDNYRSTQASTAGALAAGAERVFFTRYSFDDFRTDMSQKTGGSNYPNQEKYQVIINSR